MELHLMLCCHCCLVSGRSLNLHESTTWFNINWKQTSSNTNSDFLISEIRGSHQHLQLLQWSIICNSGPGEILSRSKSMIWFLPGRKCDGIVSLLINLQVVSTSVSSVLKTEGLSLQQPAAAIWNTQWPSTQQFSRNYIKIRMYWVIRDPFVAWKSIRIDPFSRAKLKSWPQWYVLYISTAAQE